MSQQQLKCTAGIFVRTMDDMCKEAGEPQHNPHLNSKSFWIDASVNQGFIVRGEASNEDLEIMVETFVCHCYQRYEGIDCEELLMTIYRTLQTQSHPENWQRSACFLCL